MPSGVDGNNYKKFVVWSEADAHHYYSDKKTNITPLLIKTPALIQTGAK